MLLRQTWGAAHAVEGGLVAVGVRGGTVVQRHLLARAGPRAEHRDADPDPAAGRPGRCARRRLPLAARSATSRSPANARPTPPASRASARRASPATSAPASPSCRPRPAPAWSSRPTSSTSQDGRTLATMTFVDAVTGTVLVRRDAVDTLAAGGDLPAASAVTTQAGPGAAAVPYAPTWKYFQDSPNLTAGREARRRRPHHRLLDDRPARPGGQQGPVRLPGGRRQRRLAQQPWDVDARTGLPTFTTTGNNAFTADARLGSTLTPGATAYQPQEPDPRLRQHLHRRVAQERLRPDDPGARPAPTRTRRSPTCSPATTSCTTSRTASASPSAATTCSSPTRASPARAGERPGDRQRPLRRADQRGHRRPRARLAGPGRPHRSPAATTPTR